MRAAFFRELQPYSSTEISTRLGMGNDDSRAVIDALMACGIIRYRTGDERDEEERDEAEGADDRQRYQFRYVGIAIVDGHPLACYPKYIRNNDRPVQEMRCVLNVIRKMGREGQLQEQQDDGADEGLLALMLRLLWLYDEYGIYANYEETRIINGPGVIDWTRTIDVQMPVISNGIPIYLDYWTRKTRRDERDLIMRLHRSILSECSRYLRDCGLSDLLAVDDIVLTDEAPEDLGELDLLQWLIDRERPGQYVTWKQEVLDLMKSYLLEKGMDAGESAVLRLGTTGYYHAWEVACKTAFGDLLAYRLGDLPLSLDSDWLNREDDTLLRIIPRPIWKRPLKGEGVWDVDTLVPDIVTFANNGSRRLFCIYDAKYYVPSERGKMQHQPGVESLTKQFLYQSAYHKFVEDHGFDAVVNAFFVPTEECRPKLLACASFPGVMDGVTSMSSKFSSRIDMWALPASEVFDCYLMGREISWALHKPVLGGIDEVQTMGQSISVD